MAFDVMLCPETGNVKKRPPHLRKLEKKRKKGTRRTKEEIEEKLRIATDRRKVTKTDMQISLHRRIPILQRSQPPGVEELNEIF